MSQTRYLPVPDGLHGERVDQALSRLLGLSRSAAATLLQEGNVTCGEKVLSKSDRLEAGALLLVQMPEPKVAPPPMLVPGLKIVWEDEHIVVVDKPVGVAAHPSVGWEGPTVTGALTAAGVKIATSGAQERQGVVSRLDVGTSGLMLVTKTEIAYGKMKAQFKAHSVEKIYHALVQGCPNVRRGTVDAPIGRDSTHSWKMCISQNGKPAVTHYQIIEQLRSASLIEVQLETGRTHQIRVHMAALGHPCVGDPLYGSDPTLSARLELDRQWLHAQSLAFTHPVTKERIKVSSPKYPDDIEKALEILRQL